MNCAMCQQPIDTSQPYDPGGQPSWTGIGEKTSPTHLGTCQTMPPFELVIPVFPPRPRRQRRHLRGFLERFPEYRPKPRKKKVMVAGGGL